MCFAGVVVHGQWPIVYPFLSSSSQNLYIDAVHSEQSMAYSVLIKSIPDWL